MFDRMLLPIFAVLSVLSLAYGQKPECANFAPPLFLKGRKLFNSVSGEWSEKFDEIEVGGLFGIQVHWRESGTYILTLHD